MNISLKQIEAFVAVVNLGTFDRAAFHLNLTQSTVSKRISELECELKLRLFDRTKRKAILTSDGENIYHLAKNILDDTSKLNEFSKSRNSLCKAVRLGVTEMVSLTWLPVFLKSISKTHKDVKCDVTIDLSKNLIQLLEDRYVDIIVVPETVTTSDIYSKIIGHLEISFFAKAGFIDSKKTYAIRDLIDYEIICQGTKSIFSSNVAKWLMDHGMEMSKVVRIDSLHAMMALAATGRGIAISPKYYFSPLVDRNDIVELKTNPKLPNIPYCMMFNHAPRTYLFEELGMHMRKLANFGKPYFY